ncbi:MAG: putative metal-binding motif-containing protein, partial [Myxococcota bacterium]
CTPPGAVPVDENCDGEIDEDTASDAQTFYADADGDGFGAVGSRTVTCFDPFDGQSVTEKGGDCDDTDPEVVDFIFYPDNDGDGYGDDEAAVIACEPPADWLYVTVDGGDCDDSDRNVNPEADEFCGDGIDNNCDGIAPECAWPETVSLKNGLLIEGDETADAAGWSVAVGHVTGAETPDVIVGANFASYPERADVYGAVAVVPTPITEDVNIWDQAVFFEAGGFDDFGTHVLAHDLNHDGHDDLVMTAALRSSGGYIENGAAHILYGPVTAGGIIDDVADYTINGIQEEQLLGTTMVSVGDINGDNHGDIALGTFWEDAVYLLTDSATGVHEVDDVSETEFVGTYGMDFGLRVVGIDYNGDGLEDLAITSSSYEGRGAVFFYDHGVEGYRTQDMADFTLVGEAASRFGYAIVNGGDQDGDGIDDIIVSARSASYGRIYVPWSSELLSMPNAAASPIIISNDVAGRRLAVDLSMIGDVNLDGIPDLAAGEGENYPSDVVIFHGPFNERGAWTASEAADVRLVGDPTTDGIYTAILRTNDVTGNGLDNLLVGAPDSGTGVGVGVVYILDVNIF